MKRAIGLAVVYALYGVGALHLLAHFRLRRRAIVLMYHRVLSSEARSDSWSHPAIIVTRETFARHMQVLQRHFRALSLTEFQASLDRGSFEPRSCLVTFDDGWIDTYTEAWPILRRYHIPAVVFLPSAYIGTGDVFWQERLGRLLHAIWGRARTDRAFAEEARAALAATQLDGVLDFDERGLRGRIMDLVRARKADNSTDPAAPVRQLLPLVPDAFDQGAHIDRFIDWDQAREMARDGVTFGAHGHTHRRLTTLAPDDVRMEVETSRAAVTSGLSASAAAFAYPNGDSSETVAAVVASARFNVAFSTVRGRVDAAADRLTLRRINIHEDMTSSTPMFLARLVGIV